MNPELEAILRKHRPSGILLDANLLILWIVGIADPSYVTAFKRTSVFTLKDFLLLRLLVERMGRLMTTPHVLAEVSNLLFNRERARKQDPRWERLLDVFVEQVSDEQWMIETHQPASEVCRSSLFKRFGLTDAAISLLTEKNVLLVSTDQRLIIELEQSELPVLNFNHLRDSDDD